MSLAVHAHSYPPAHHHSSATATERRRSATAIEHRSGAEAADRRSRAAAAERRSSVDSIERSARPARLDPAAISRALARALTTPTPTTDPKEIAHRLSDEVVRAFSRLSPERRKAVVQDALELVDVWPFIDHHIAEALELRARQAALNERLERGLRLLDRAEQLEREASRVRGTARASLLQAARILRREATELLAPPARADRDEVLPWYRRVFNALIRDRRQEDIGSRRATHLDGYVGSEGRRASGAEAERRRSAEHDRGSEGSRTHHRVRAW